jgi:AraC-like DNA-binding protein
MDKNISIHICDRDCVNLTLNIYHCGNMDVRDSMQKKIDYYMLYYVHDGSGSVTVNNICYRLSRGSVFGMFPNRDFVIKPEFGTVMNISWVAFSGYMVEHYLRRGGITPSSPVVCDSKEFRLEQFFIKILSDSRVLPNRYCKLMASLYSVFAFLLDNCYNDAAPANYSLEYYLLKALDFIDIYYNDNISVEQIADHAGVTRKYLYKVFKQLTDFSPKEYLIYYRLEKSTQLLADQNLSVENVAISVGYANQFCFSKEFKKIVGKTPSEYRAAIIKNPADHYVSPINTINKEYFNI